MTTGRSPRGRIALPPVVVGAAEPDALFPEARARQRRRRARAGILGLAGIAIAAGAAGLFGSFSSHSLTVGQIAARETAAVKRADHMIVRQRTHRPLPRAFLATLSNRASFGDCHGCNELVWVDRATLASRTVYYDSHGAPFEQDTTRYLGNGRFRLAKGVDYKERTWFTYYQGDRPLGTSNAYRYGPAEIATMELGPVGTYPLSDRNLHYRIVGSETVDGQATYKLETRVPAPARARVFDLWINKSTFLPVREQVRQAGELRESTDLAWLPRTPANLATLKLGVPTGFRHI